MRTKLEEEMQSAVSGPETRALAAPGPHSPSGEAEPPRSLHAYRAEAEANAISRALELVGWNRRRAAELLRISYRGLLYKIRQYNITARSQGRVKAEPGGEQLDES